MQISDGKEMSKKQEDGRIKRGERERERTREKYLCFSFFNQEMWKQKH